MSPILIALSMVLGSQTQRSQQHLVSKSGTHGHAKVQKARFRGDLSQPDPIPEEGIETATSLMRDGRLFRYGESNDGLPETALLEEEFARYIGRKYCAGVNSCGCALFLALKALGVRPGDRVLANAFTLAPVPGAIAHAGGEPVIVDVTDRTVVDLKDLERKAVESGAKHFVLSYMRGHIPDMDELMSVCDRLGLTVVEDCAHTMGAGWDGRLTGTFGKIGCFSTQTFKHMNSGEGGLIVTDDEDLAAKVILMSGSYMLYGQHKARPPLPVFEKHRYHVPNCSMRMSSLVASILRPQLKALDERNEDWRRIYDWIAPELSAVQRIDVPERPAKEEFVPSSIQFSLRDMSDEQIEVFLEEADARGVHVKWFGHPDPVGFTSRHDHWHYCMSHAPNADEVLANLCDVRLPSSLEFEDCQMIAKVIRESMDVALWHEVPSRTVPKP